MKRRKKMKKRKKVPPEDMEWIETKNVNIKLQFMQFPNICEWNKPSLVEMPLKLIPNYQ